MGLLLMGGLLSFYIFAAIRLRALRAAAPDGAKGFLSAAIRGSLASALQKLGIIAILLFLGLRQDESAVKENLAWIVLLVLLPTGWMILSAFQQRQARSQLDAEAEAFLRSLDEAPAFSWKPRI